mgnify:CR=1 FL=1
MKLRLLKPEPLTAAAFEVANSACADPAEAREAFLALLETTLVNLRRESPERALSGPIARGDAATDRPPRPATAPNNLEERPARPPERPRPRRCYHLGQAIRRAVEDAGLELADVGGGSRAVRFHEVPFEARPQGSLYSPRSQPTTNAPATREAASKWFSTSNVRQPSGRPRVNTAA